MRIGICGYSKFDSLVYITFIYLVGEESMKVPLYGEEIGEPLEGDGIAWFQLFEEPGEEMDEAGGQAVLRAGKLLPCTPHLCSEGVH